MLFRSYWKPESGLNKACAMLLANVGGLGCSVGLPAYRQPLRTLGAWVFATPVSLGFSPSTASETQLRSIGSSNRAMSRQSHWHSKLLAAVNFMNTSTIWAASMALALADLIGLRYYAGTPTAAIFGGLMLSAMATAWAAALEVRAR